MNKKKIQMYEVAVTIVLAFVGFIGAGWTAVLQYRAAQQAKAEARAFEEKLEQANERIFNQGNQISQQSREISQKADSLVAAYKELDKANKEIHKIQREALNQLTGL